MRKRVFSPPAILFLVAFAVVLLSPLMGHAFWYGSQTLEEIAIDADITDRFGNTCGDICRPTDCEGLATARDWLLQNHVFGFENNPDNQVGITINEPGSWEGYNLLSCVGGCTHGDAPDPTTRYYALLIGPDGEFVQGWENVNGIPSKLIPGGYLMGGRGPGFGGDQLVIQDWCGNEVWNAQILGGTWHHDHQIMNSASGEYSPIRGAQPRLTGKRLVLANHEPGQEYDYPRGWLGTGHPAYSTDNVSDLFGIEGLDDAIYELDQKGRIRWQWFASQHVDQMNFSTIEREAVRTNCVGRGCRRGNSDWTHFNNANWLGENPNSDDPRFHPDNIIFDSRTNGMIGIIAHDDDPGGTFQKGDIVWQIGPGQHVFMDGVDIGPIIGPHNAHFIAKGNPGEGNIIVFDNGGNSCFGVLDFAGIEGCDPDYPVALRDYSRILEIDPLTQSIVWSYENKAAPGFTDTYGNWNRKFFSSFISSVQRTPIGTTIITEGNQARIFEVNQEGQIVWEYMAAADPGGPGVIGRALYRSYRYPDSYLPQNWASITCE